MRTSIWKIVPTTRASAASVKAGKMVAFKFRISDAAPSCGKAVVKIEIRKGSKLAKTISVGTRATNVALIYKCKATLNRGTYSWRVLATDIAGNKATKMVPAKLKVT